MITERIKQGQTLYWINYNIQIPREDRPKPIINDFYVMSKRHPWPGEGCYMGDFVNVDYLNKVKGFGGLFSTRSKALSSIAHNAAYN